MKLKSLFKKLFGGLNLVLLLVVVLGFAGNLGGGLEVEAATKSGYFVNARSIPEATGFGATGCEDIGSRDFIFCANAPDPNSRLDAALQYITTGCTQATCRDGNDTYTDCKPAFLNASIWSCTAKSTSTSSTGSNGSGTVTNTNTRTLTSNNITCDLSSQDTIDKTKINKIALSNCKDAAGAQIKDPTVVCVGFVNGSNQLDFTCKGEIIYFGRDRDAPTGSGDTSIAAVNWRPESGGRVFQTLDGGSLFLENGWTENSVDASCIGGAERFLQIASLGIFTGAARGLEFYFAGNAYNCSEQPNFGAFKTVLKSNVTGAQSGLIDQIAPGPDVTQTQSKIQNRENCQTLTLAQVNEIKAKTDDQSKKQAQQIEKLRTDGVWDGSSDLQLCNGGALVCGNQKGTSDGSTTCVDPELNSADYSQAGGINRNAAAVENKNPADAILDFVIKVASIALALVLYIFTLIGLIVLFFFGVFVLWLLDINPAALNFVDVAQRPWGLLASVGNILILGAFMYVGFGYMMGIANMKKSLGDFLLKIVYYAMLLNFTLLGAATIVNIGYGVGNLIKFGYASSSSKADVNQQLMGNIIGPIGRISYLRCPNPESPECNFEIADNTDVFGQAAGKSGGAGFTSLWKDANSAMAGAVAEGVTLVMIGFALYVFWKALYVVFYRIVALWMLMILSPIALASYFSPVDEWKSIGTEMFSKFWKLVLFYPAFIFALVLVNTMSGAFNSAAKAATGSSSPATAGTTTTPFSIAVFANSPATAFQSMTLTVLGAGVAMMGLWIIVKYFTDSFEADMGKIGGGIKGAYEGAIGGLSKGFNVAKKGMHIAGAPMRGLGTASKWALKKGGIDVDKIGGDWEKGKGWQRGLAAVGRTTGNLLTGRTLYDLENKAGMAKKLWDGMGNGEKKVLAGQKARDEVKNSVLLRKIGLGGILDDSGTDAARGLSRDVLYGPDGKELVNNLIGSQVAGAKASVVGDVKNLPDDVLEAKLRAMIDPKTGETKVDDDIFNDLFDQALKTNNNKVLQMITSNSAMHAAAQKMYSDDRLSDEASKAVGKNNGSFLDDDKVKINARGKAADKNYSASVVEMMDDRFNKSYLDALDAQIQQGEKDALERKNRYLASRAQQLGDVTKRAYEALYKHSDKDLKKHNEAKGANGDLYKPEDFYDEKILGGGAGLSAKPLGLTHSDYVTASNAIKSGASGIHAQMTDDEYTAVVSAHPELAKIGNKPGLSTKDRKNALAQAFNVGGKIHAASSSTQGLETQKVLLEQIASGATLSANDQLKLGLQHETQIESTIVAGIMREYAASVDELKKDVDEYRTKNAGSTQREAEQKVKEARKKMAEQSAKAIKQHMSNGLDGANVDTQIEQELSKYMNVASGMGQTLANQAKQVTQGVGGLANNARAVGQTKAQQMASSGVATAEISVINAQIESMQKEAIKNASKLNP